MKLTSPFRYPGAKSRYARELIQYVNGFSHGAQTYVDRDFPYGRRHCDGVPFDCDYGVVGRPRQGPFSPIRRASRRAHVMTILPVVAQVRHFTCRTWAAVL